MQYVLGSMEPDDPTVSIETWVHPISRQPLVTIDVTGQFDSCDRSMSPAEARELADALNRAAASAEELA